MNDIIGLLKRGDLLQIAEDASAIGKRNVEPSLVSNIIHGRRDIEGYPHISQALRDYVKRRERELQEESKLVAATAEVYSKLKMKPPSDEELLLRNLNAQKISRLNRQQLIFLIGQKRLKIKAKDHEDDDDLREAVINSLGLKKDSGFASFFKL